MLSLLGRSRLRWFRVHRSSYNLFGWGGGLVGLGLYLLQNSRAPRHLFPGLIQVHQRNVPTIRVIGSMQEPTWNFVSHAHWCRSSVATHLHFCTGFIMSQYSSTVGTRAWGPLVQVFGSPLWTFKCTASCIAILPSEVVRSRQQGFYISCGQPARKFAKRARCLSPVFRLSRWSLVLW